MSIDDILNVRELVEVAASPIGDRIAYVVREADVADNSYRWMLYTVEPDGRESRLVTQRARQSITHLRWAPSGQALTFLAQDDQTTQIWQITPDGGAAGTLFTHPTSVAQFEWSDDGRSVAFVAPASDGADGGRNKAGGVVYDPTYRSNDAFRELVDGRWQLPDIEVWKYETTTRDASRLWKAPGTVRGLHWSPTSRYLAVPYSRDDPASRAAGGWDRNLVVLSTEGTVVNHIEWVGSDGNPVWSPDGQGLLFMSDGPAPPDATALPPPRLFSLDINSKSTRLLGHSTTWQWSDAITRSDRMGRLLVERDDRHTSAVYTFDLENGALTQLSRGTDHLSGCSYDRLRTRAACIRQNPTSPPDVAAVDLRTGDVSSLTALNPQVSRFALGEVSELRWATSRGYRVNAFLVKPVSYVPGRRYPAIVVLYGFSSTFISQAQWITSYPVETLAASGFAVLLTNLPEPHRFASGDAKEGLVSLVYDPLDAIETAAARLVDMGIADPQRVGIAGWSRGCFLTAVAVTHSSRFSAASCGDGFIFSPSRYWLTMGRFQTYMESRFGGPPYGDSYAAYARASPPLLADRVRAPVLLEYVAKNVTGLEFYTALRRHNVPSEYVVYADETHSFSQPKNRLASMQRNLDWFRYWLLGKRDDSDPERAKQYERWRKLGAARDAREQP